MCAAKHAGRGGCTWQAMLIEEVKRLVERHYETVQISAQTRHAVAKHRHGELDKLMASESDALTSREVPADALTWAENARNENEVRTSTGDGSSIEGSHLVYLG